MMENKLKFYVYAHYRKTDDKLFYIGKGSTNRASTKSKRNPIWTNIYRKHGFYYKILEMFDNEIDALKKEEELILYYRSIGVKLANIANGGSANSGTRHSVESKLKMSLSRKGKKIGGGWKHSEETKRKMSISHLGKKLSQQQIIKQRQSMVGKPKSEEHKKNLSISRAGIKIPATWKGVCCIDTNMYYESLSDAADQTGLDISHIVKCCKGKLDHIKGFTFVYA